MINQGLNFSTSDLHSPRSIVNEVLHITGLSFLYQALEGLGYQEYELKWLADQREHSTSQLQEMEQSRGGIVALCFAFIRPHPEYSIQFWTSHYNKGRGSGEGYQDDRGWVIHLAGRG